MEALLIIQLITCIPVIFTGPEDGVLQQCEYTITLLQAKCTKNIVKEKQLIYKLATVGIYMWLLLSHILIMNTYVASYMRKK